MLVTVKQITRRKTRKIQSTNPFLRGLENEVRLCQENKAKEEKNIKNSEEIYLYKKKLNIIF